MSIFNDSIPANSESIKQGATRIREIKTALNTMLGGIFDDTMNFLVKWVTANMLQNDSSDDTKRAVGSDHIKTAAVTTTKLADGVLSADATGRAKMATGFIEGSHLASDFSLPTGSVGSDALAFGAVATSKLADLAVTVAKVGAGVAKIAIGSYAGSNTTSATVSGLSFAPDLVFFTGGASVHQCLLAMRQEASGSPLVGPAHALWTTGGIGSPLNGAIEWTSDGFIVIPFNQAGLNDNGATHSYIALKV